MDILDNLKNIGVNSQGIIEPTKDDMESLRSHYSIEYMLRLLIREGYLLHGSLSKITLQAGCIPGERTFARGRADVALLQALVSNDEARVHCPYFIPQDMQLEVYISNPHKTTIHKDGYVYVVERKGFRNVPQGSWQYVKRDGYAPVVMNIPVSLEDFEYVVYDKDTLERLL